jgi:outer membrane protein TolC
MSDRGAVAKLFSAVMLVASLAGCASSSLSLAPESSDTPFKPEPVGGPDETAPAPLPRVTPTGARDFGLEPLPELEFTSEATSIDASHVYSLAELIDLAQTNNPETRVAWERAREAALAVGIVKAFYLPMLSATAIGGYQHSSNSTEIGGVLSTSGNGNSTGSVTGVGMQWLLFDFGQRDALKSAATSLSLASNIAFNGVHQKIIFDVSRSFYDYTSARQRVAIAEKSLNESARISQAANEKFKGGLGTAVETAQATQLFAQANFNLVQARGAERDIYHGLIAAVGITPSAKLRIADVSGRPLSPAAMVPVERLIHEAVARRADIQASYAAAQAAHAGIAAAQAEFLPKVFLSASGTYVTGNLNVTSTPTLNLGGLGSTSLPNVSSSSSLSSTNGTVLGGVTVPLFDGGIRDARLREAQSRDAAAGATLQRLEHSAAWEIVAADDALRSSLAAYQAANALVAASRTTQDAALTAYQSGAGPITAAIEAEKALLAARLAQEQTHGTALIAAATLAFATGRLSSSDAVDARRIP